MLQSNASIESLSGVGMSKAQILKLINETTEPEYLKKTDADDLYAPRVRSVQLQCIAFGLETTSAEAISSAFADTFSFIDASRVSAVIDGNTLRLIVSCDESNVTSVKDTLAQLDAASLETKLLPVGVTISRNDALTVGTALLTKSGVPVMLLS